MERSLSPLLPGPDEAVRCAQHARSIGVDPGGTAIRADRIVLVGVPAPWPKPALDHARLSGLRAELASSLVPTRLLATAPSDDAPDGAGTGAGIEVTVFDRVGPSARQRRFLVEGEADLVALGRALARSRPEASPGTSPGDTTSARGPVDDLLPAPRAILICTQGSHDVCCGSEGARLAADLDAVDDLDVYRVSHTGGHRFAPTAMTLPDGRMWAGLDPDRVAHILAATGDVVELAALCRGWWGAEVGPAQVAERAVFAAEGWALDQVERRVTVDGEWDGGSIGCTVVTGEASWEVRVAEGRTVPTIACRQPGGQPAKLGPEYEVVSIRRRLSRR
jgi:hypothetical protein